MRTRVSHILAPDTVETLVNAKNGTPWRKCAVDLGYAESYAATLNQAARGLPGAMTCQAENVLRGRLGLPVIQLIAVPACPDCGQIHTGRCHGRTVVQVVVISHGERVARAPVRRIRTLSDVPVRTLAAWLRDRQPYQPES